MFVFLLHSKPFHYGMHVVHKAFIVSKKTFLEVTQTVLTFPSAFHLEETMQKEVLDSGPCTHCFGLLRPLVAQISGYVSSTR